MLFDTFIFVTFVNYIAQKFCKISKTSAKQSNLVLKTEWIIVDYNEFKKKFIKRTLIIMDYSDKTNQFQCQKNMVVMVTIS